MTVVDTVEVGVVSDLIREQHVIGLDDAESVTSAYLLHINRRICMHTVIR